jgi:hypothetical protein
MATEAYIYGYLLITTGVGRVQTPTSVHYR